MPDDPKKPRPPAYRDYSAGRKTPAQGYPVPPLPPLRIESTGERGDPTPPPFPGTITNEDLALQVRAVDKKHDEFATTTTARLTIVEAATARIPAIDTKVDKLLMFAAEKEQKREILTMDVTRMHAEVETKEKQAEVEKQMLVVKDEKAQKDYERKIKLKAASLAATAAGIVATGLTILAHHC